MKITKKNVDAAMKKHKVGVFDAVNLLRGTRSIAQVKRKASSKK